MTFKMKVAASLAIILGVLLFSCKTPIIPGITEITINNIYAEYFILGDAYNKLGEYEKAAEFYEKAAGSKEHRVGALYNAARCYAFCEKWDESFKLYDILQEADPENRILSENRAYLLYRKGDIQKSKELYSSMVAQYPDDKKLLQNYINVLAEMKDFTESENQIEVYKTRFGEDEEITKIAGDVKTAKEGPEPEETDSESQSTDEDTSAE